MRLARLAAVGLAIGVIAGFAIALLRPRPSARPGAPDRNGRSPDPADRVEEVEEPARKLAGKLAQKPGQSSVLDMRTRRRVTG